MRKVTAEAAGWDGASAIQLHETTFSQSTSASSIHLNSEVSGQEPHGMLKRSKYSYSSMAILRVVIRVGKDLSLVNG